MLRKGTLTQAALRVASIAALLAVSGCSLLAPEPPTVDVPDVVIDPPEPVATEPASPADTPDKPPAAPNLPPVAIVLTSQQPAYADVASELARRFDDYEIYDLSDRRQPPITVLRTINDSGSGAVVAIGNEDDEGG